MSTDVVIFRTERIVPRLGVVDGHPRANAGPPTPEPRPLVSIEEIDGGPGVLDGIADRLAAGRARLGQLTFYLLDAESWR